MCQWGANRNPWAGGYRIGPFPILYVPGVEKFQQPVVNVNRALAGCEAMQRTIIRLLLWERRSSKICAVVKRPDHHCGDDLVRGYVAVSEQFVCLK